MRATKIQAAKVAMVMASTIEDADTRAWDALYDLAVPRPAGAKRTVARTA
jgi:hypothetical protein